MLIKFYWIYLLLAIVKFNRLMIQGTKKDTKIDAVLRQPLVIGSVCTCTKFRETPIINGKHICSICNKPIVQTDL